MASVELEKNRALLKNEKSAIFKLEKDIGASKSEAEILDRDLEQKKSYLKALETEIEDKKSTLQDEVHSMI